DAADVPRCCAYSAGSPSSVVIALPETAATGVTQLLISLPSNNTEQAPHCANPQPKRGPCRCSSLCRTYRRGVSRLAVTLCTRPFTLIFSLLAILTLRWITCDWRRKQEGADPPPAAASGRCHASRPLAIVAARRTAAGERRTVEESRSRPDFAVGNPAGSRGGLGSQTRARRITVRRTFWVLTAALAVGCLAAATGVARPAGGDTVTI